MPPAPAASVAQAVAMVGMTVSDMDRSVAFYTRVLDFEQVSDDELGRPSLRAADRGLRRPRCASCVCGSGDE